MDKVVFLLWDALPAILAAIGAFLSKGVANWSLSAIRGVLPQFGSDRYVVSFDGGKRESMAIRSGQPRELERKFQHYMRFEDDVFARLQEQQPESSIGRPVFSLSRNLGDDFDFLIEGAGRKYAVECKMDPRSRDVGALLRKLEQNRCDRLHLFVPFLKDAELRESLEKDKVVVHSVGSREQMSSEAGKVWRQVMADSQLPIAV